jgi:MraZ protein
MYCGEHNILLDDKNRITVPAKHRKVMDELQHADFYMCRGFDGCLFLFPEQEWDKIWQDTRKYAALDARAVDLRRMLFGSVHQVAPDSQGRIPVPETLRDYACLDKEATLIGADDHIEVWNRSGWKEFQRKREPQYRDMVSGFFAQKTSFAGEPVTAAGAAGGGITGGSGGDL